MKTTHTPIQFTQINTKGHKLLAQIKGLEYGLSTAPPATPI